MIIIPPNEWLTEADSVSGEGLLPGLLKVREVISLNPHMAEKREKQALTSVPQRALISFVRAPPSRFNYLPKSPPPKISHWGLGVQHMNSGETQTFSP